MVRLAMTLFSVIATTLMGTFVIVALVAGYVTLVPILVAAGLGFVAAVPVSWFVARAIS
nr:CTP synthetase [Pseudoruegeria sp. HB172150]